MTIIPDIMTECLNTVAAHYAAKARARNMHATEQDVQQAVVANWASFSRK